MSPRFLTNAVIFTATLYLLALVALVLLPPYAGFDLASDEDGQLYISSLDEAAADAGLRTGERVVRLTSATGVTVELDASFYPSSTVIARELHETVEGFIRSMNLMNDVLSAPPLRVETESGRVVELQLNEPRPISSIPLEVWYCLFLSVVPWFVPALVWAWRPRDTDITYMTLSGFGLGLATISAATMYQMELYYPPAPMFWITMVLVGFGNFVFVTFAAAAFLYFPQRLPRANLLSFVLFSSVLGYTLWVFFDGWQWGRPLSEQMLTFEYGEVYFVEITVYAAILLAVALQGFYTRRNPLAKAEVLWIAFAAVMTPMVFFGLYLIPVMMGYEALLSRTWTTTLLVIGFLLLALGVSRLRFLNVTRHIGAIYQWTLVAMLFLVLDGLLVYTLNINIATSTVIMTAVLLFVYLPIRQWLMGRLTRQRVKDYQGLFAQASDALVQGSLKGRTPDEVWPEILQNVFAPITLEKRQARSESGIEERGQSLRVSGNQFADGYVLHYADGGTRLFNADDLDLVVSLQELFIRMFDYRDGVTKGQVKERERIRRDLHDQVGHKLLSLIYRTEDEASQKLAGDTMEQLREIMKAMKQEPVELQQLASDLRSACMEASHALSIQCEVNEDVGEDSRPVPSLYYLNLLSICRELINNTSKHAEASHIEVAIVADENNINLTYQDDGKGFDLKQVERGNGLFNITSRAEEMGGTITWVTTGGTRFDMSIPLEMGAAA